jgi:hypothetical protein
VISHSLFATVLSHSSLLLSGGARGGKRLAVWSRTRRLNWGTGWLTGSRNKAACMGLVKACGTKLHGRCRWVGCIWLCRLVRPWVQVMDPLVYHPSVHHQNQSTSQQPSQLTRVTKPHVRPRWSEPACAFIPRLSRPTPHTP